MLRLRYASKSAAAAAPAQRETGTFPRRECLALIGRISTPSSPRNITRYLFSCQLSPVTLLGRGSVLSRSMCAKCVVCTTRSNQQLLSELLRAWRDAASPDGSLSAATLERRPARWAPVHLGSCHRRQQLLLFLHRRSVAGVDCRFENRCGQGQRRRGLAKSQKTTSNLMFRNPDGMVGMTVAICSRPGRLRRLSEHGLIR